MTTKVCNRVLVERYFLNELVGEKKNDLRQHLDNCADCQSLYNQLQIDSRNYAMTFPFREFVARPGMGERLDRLDLCQENKVRGLKMPRWLPALAGIAVCLMVLPVLQNQLEQVRGSKWSYAESGVRTKGEPILEFYCERDGVVHAGLETETYRAGDELQFVYAGASHGQSASYVTLASIDAQGLVSLYRSEGESLRVSIPAKPGNRQPLPFSVTLDHSPGSEFFVLIYSSKPLDGERVDAWLKGAYTSASGNLELLDKSLAPPNSPKSMVKSLLLKKEQP